MRKQKTVSITVDADTLTMMDEIEFALRAQYGLRGRSAVVRYLVRNQIKGLRAARSKTVKDVPPVEDRIEGNGTPV